MNVEQSVVVARSGHSLREARVSDAMSALAHSRMSSAVIETACDVFPVSTNGALAGVPIVIKDCFVDGGRIPTMGSRAPARWLSGTAEILQRLRGAGAAIAAYSNLHEWMVGTSSRVSAFGPVINPRDPSLIAGGSSGGSAAVVAAGAVPVAIGSDAGGSIRIPAACCGVVGMKPTWGRVPTEGFADHGSPIDHIGPLARTVDDARSVLEVLIGDVMTAVDLERLRIGIARRPFFEAADPAVARVVLDAAERLRPLVRSIADITLEGMDRPNRTVAAFILRDVARLLATDRTDRRDVLQPETAATVAFGASISDDDRAAAERARTRIVETWDRAFADVDVIVSPTLPGRVATVSKGTVALPAGEISAEVAYVAWNGPMDLGGVPCLSVPCGELPDGQSVSMSLTAARGRDDIALAVGEAIESLRS